MSDKIKQKICWQKKRFYDTEKAKQSIKLMRKRYGRNMEYYQCPICDFYHLSTKKEEKGKVK